ncbi:hypothetical protein [Spirosoma sp.]|uniref:hypothetical protein n=1 Tax=Spirosoma sp. TaxID=1899569 RepID=UPI0026180D71|nr:hypothetical protein [Spirosoma sp.]MCX6216376.1 hypothetical protein [Spirosoma sp.]
MCTCISILSKPESYTHPKGKKIVNVETPTALRWDQQANTLSAVTVSEALVTVEGRKSKEKFTLDHTYCPFCGEKYGADLTSAKDENPAA